MNENPKKSNDKRKRGGAEKVGQSGIGRKSLPLIVISFFSLNLPHFQNSFLAVYHSLISDNIKPSCLVGNRMKSFCKKWEVLLYRTNQCVPKFNFACGSSCHCFQGWEHQLPNHHHEAGLKHPRYFNQKRLLKCWFEKIDSFEIWLRVCVDCWQLILGLTGLQRPSNYANILPLAQFSCHQSCGLITLQCTQIWGGD